MNFVTLHNFKIKTNDWFYDFASLAVTQLTFLIAASIINELWEMKPKCRNCLEVIQMIGVTSTQENLCDLKWQCGILDLSVF